MFVSRFQVDNYIREIELLTLDQYGDWFKPKGTRMKKIRKKTLIAGNRQIQLINIDKLN